MKIEHAALYVNDLEGARSFFVNYLGAKSNEGYHNLKTGFRSYFLSFGDGARLEIMNKPEMPDYPKEFARTGYAHIAFSVGSKEKVDALTAELKTDGYEVVSGPRTTGDSYAFTGNIRSMRENRDFRDFRPRSATKKSVRRLRLCWRTRCWILRSRCITRHFVTWMSLRGAYA